MGVGNPLFQLEQLKDLKMVTGVGLIPEGTGKDLITGGSGLDFIVGGNDRDVIQAGDGFNVVFGDEITIGAGVQTDLSQVFSTPEDATSPISPGLTGLGNDTILGGNTVDIFWGGAGDDDLRSFGGIDLLFGNDGNDLLSGGDGNDILIGGNGNDWLVGGPNNDVHQGGDGADNFVFDNPSAERDSFWNFGGWISDFDPANPQQGDQDRSNDPSNPADQPPQLGLLTLLASPADPKPAVAHAFGPLPAGSIAVQPATPQPGDAQVADIQWLLPLVSAAQQDWIRVVPAITEAFFMNVSYGVADLPGTLLGHYSRLSNGKHQVTIDTDAAGVGWFIDRTPLLDEEFVAGSSQQMHAPASSPASGHVDLLTVVRHELGHVLGLPDLAGDAHSGSLMAGSLSVGVRRVPARDDSVWTVAGVRLDGLPPGETHLLHLDAPREVVNGSFTVEDPAAAGFGWSTLGAATVGGGVGLLEEDGAFNSRFSQTVEIPAQATALRFTVQVNLSDDGTTAPDAFEFALIDAHSGDSVLAIAAGLGNTDALLNIQADGTTYFAPAVSSPGLGSSGEILSYATSRTFTIALTGLTTDVTATLYFDLLGFGAFDSSVTIDDVQLLGARPAPCGIAVGRQF